LTGRIHLDRAARAIRAGGIVAYPTEAVFGLGCLPDDRDAVLRLLAIKRRPWQKGFVLIAASFEDLAPLVELPTDPMRSAILATWPGPVTWALPARRAVPRWLKGRPIRSPSSSRPTRSRARSARGSAGRSSLRART